MQYGNNLPNLDPMHYVIYANQSYLLFLLCQEDQKTQLRNSLGYESSSLTKSFNSPKCQANNFPVSYLPHLFSSKQLHQTQDKEKGQQSLVEM